MQAGSIKGYSKLSRSLLGVFSDYVALTKPRIISLLIVTAIGSMFLAANGVPKILTLLLVITSGSLGAGGANALNHYFDRDIDEQMKRTSKRPVPGGRIKPNMAFLFGVILNIIAFIILYIWVNLLSAVLVLCATLFYILIYTKWLKRTTVQNIVIGGAAGAVPPLVGWAAVTGTLSLPAWYLFAIIFFWTPPHFWALSLLIKDDYAAAKIPMMPVVSGISATTKNIMMHSIILVALTILLFTTRSVGITYLAGSIISGIIFLILGINLYRDPTLKAARTLYLYSLIYLTFIFALIAIDVTL